MLVRGFAPHGSAQLWSYRSCDQKSALEIGEEIRLVPENGTLRLDVKGELAGILALCDAGKKKPGQADPAGLDQQIKMVAGVGFEPTTFRL